MRFSVDVEGEYKLFSLKKKGKSPETTFGGKGAWTRERSVDARGKGKPCLSRERSNALSLEKKEKGQTRLRTVASREHKRQ